MLWMCFWTEKELPFLHAFLYSIRSVKSSKTLCSKNIEKWIKKFHGGKKA